MSVPAFVVCISLLVLLLRNPERKHSAVEGSQLNLAYTLPKLVYHQLLRIKALMRDGDPVTLIYQMLPCA